MASTLFQPYVDKENTAARSKQRDGLKQGLGGKVFHSTGPALTTPRSALRDVNKDPQQSASRSSSKGLKSQKPSAPVEQLFKKPALQPVDPVHKSNGKVDKQQRLTTHSDSKSQVITKKPEPLPEIERLIIYNAAKEEVKPKRDSSFIGVIDKLRSWRPPCLTGLHSDSYSEDEEPVEKLHLDLLDVPDPELPSKDELEEEDVISLSDLPIPFIDEDLPIPFLDDSVDIEPNLGTLEVWDTSTPYKLSNGTSASGETPQRVHDTLNSLESTSHSSNTSV